MSVFLVERVRILPLSFVKPPAVEGCLSGKVFRLKIRPEQVEIFHRKPVASAALAEGRPFRRTSPKTTFAVTKGNEIKKIVLSYRSAKHISNN